MLALADVVHLLADELARGGRRASTPAQLLLRALHRASLWHDLSLIAIQGSKPSFPIPLRAQREEVGHGNQNQAFGSCRLNVIAERR